MHARILGLAAFAACLTVPAVAAVALSDAAGSYTISPSSSSIRFTIGKAGGGGFDGAFARFKGTIRIDNGDVGRSKVDLTIYPESVGTGQSRIDAFLRSDAVFDSANNPEIQFRSTNVTRTGDTTAVVTGRLTARGKTFSEKFTAELDGLKAGTIKFRVTGKVLRSRYGMDVGTPIYSNVVDFNMTLTGKRG